MENDGEWGREAALRASPPYQGVVTSSFSRIYKGDCLRHDRDFIIFLFALAVLGQFNKTEENRKSSRELMPNWETKSFALN